MTAKIENWSIDKAILILAYGRVVLISFTFLLMDLLGQNASMYFNSSALFFSLYSTYQCCLYLFKIMHLPSSLAWHRYWAFPKGLFCSGYSLIN
tara:strand:- start:295 stop:576 length:282 start_codon:yes stop_codon:yes gene_type:complete